MYPVRHKLQLPGDLFITKYLLCVFNGLTLGEATIKMNRIIVYMYNVVHYTVCVYSL